MLWVLDWTGIAILDQTLDLKLFGYGKEGIQIFLCNIDFAVVNEIQDRCQIVVGYSAHIDVRIGEILSIGLFTKDVFEDILAGWKNNFVCLQSF